MQRDMNRQLFFWVTSSFLSTTLAGFEIV